MNSKTKFSFVPDGGVTGALLRSMDWDNHKMGPVEKWPAVLKVTLATMFGSRHPMFLFWGPDHICFYNDAYMPSFGQGKHPSAMGQTGIECWPEIWSVIFPQIEEAMKKGMATWHENQYLPIQRNGKIEDVWWTYSYSPLRDEDGDIRACFVVCTETTTKVVAMEELKASEELLKKSEISLNNARQQLMNFFMQAPTPMVILLGAEHRFTLANPPYEKLIGKQATGKRVVEVFNPEEVSHFIPLLDSVYNTGTPVIANELPLNTYDAKGTLLNLWIDIGYYPFRDSEENIIGIMAIVTDVTDQVTARKKIESYAKELLFEQHKQDLIFYSAPAAMVLWKGEDLIFEKVNPEFSKFFHNRELVGKSLLEALPEMRGQPFSDILKNVYKTGKTFIANEEMAQIQNIHTNTLEDRYFDFTYLQVTDTDGKPYGVYEHAIEVTEKVHSRRALEQLVKDLTQERELRERFVAALSHDLRTPLTAAKLSSQVLARKLVNDTSLSSAAHRITENMERADGMIRDLLDASLIKAGEKIPLKITSCCMNDLINETIDDLSSIHGDRFIFNPPVIVGGFWDRDGIKRVLENLASNGIKYGTSGRPVTFTVSSQDDLVQVTVNNEGGKISSKELFKLFDPFKRSKAAQTGDQKGWGLGLTLVKGYTEAHGGNVIVSSSEQEGTTFLVTIPYDSNSFV